MSHQRKPNVSEFREKIQNKNQHLFTGAGLSKSSYLPEAGIEPARGCPHGILSPGRLPVPPFGLGTDQQVAAGYYDVFFRKSQYFYKKLERLLPLPNRWASEEVFLLIHATDG